MSTSDGEEAAAAGEAASSGASVTSASSGAAKRVIARFTIPNTVSHRRPPLGEKALSPLFLSPSLSQ